MTAQEYIDGLASEPTLRDLGARGSDFRVLDQNRGIAMIIPADAIARTSWRAIAPVLLGRRNPLVLKRITRIVGYFSMEHNWNGSKIAEQADRRRGNYGLDGGGTTVALSDDLPDEVLAALAHVGRLTCSVARNSPSPPSDNRSDA